MSDRIGDAQARLTTLLGTKAATAITLIRGVATTATFGTRGRTEYTQHLADGAAIEAHIQDWLIAVANYRFSGTLTQPAAGDKIREIDVSGKSWTWEVRPHLNQPAWRHADPHRNMYRIHVKLAETVLPP